MTRPTVFLDVEADGLHPNRRPWEIAMVRREPDGTERELAFFVALNLQASDPVGLDIGRFWDRHPTGRKLSGKPATPGDAVVVYNVHDASRTVMQWTFGATIVGAVPSFDTDILARMLRSEGHLPAWHHRLRCVETMAYGHLKREPGGLRDCADALGIPYRVDALHTALGDARLARDIHDHILEAAA